MKTAKQMDDWSDADVRARLRAFIEDVPSQRPSAGMCAHWGARLAAALLGREAIAEEMEDADVLFRSLPDPLPERAGRMLCACALDMARGGAWPESRLRAGLRATLACLEDEGVSSPVLHSREPEAAPSAIIRALPAAPPERLAPPRVRAYPLEDGLFVCADAPEGARGVYLHYEGEEEAFYSIGECASGVRLPVPAPNAALCARASYEGGDSRVRRFSALPKALCARLGVRVWKGFLPLGAAIPAMAGCLPLLVRVCAEEEEDIVPPLVAVFGAHAAPISPEGGRELSRQAARRTPSFLRLPRMRAPGYVTVFAIEDGEPAPVCLLRVLPGKLAGGGRA